MAVTIFSITAVSLYSVFYTGIRVLRRSETAMKQHQDLRVVMEELSLDLRNSLLAPLYEDKAQEPIAEEGEQEKIFFFLGDRDRFSFVTLKDTFTAKGKSRRQVCNATYFISEGEGARELMRTIQYQCMAFAVSPDSEEALLSDIEDAEFLYSYEGDDEDSPPIWLDVWEQEEKVPLGVKVKLTLKGLGSLRRFTKTIFIPVGALGVEEVTEF